MEAGKLNVSKCSFGQRDVKFFCHTALGEGHQLDPANVQAVKNMKPQTNFKYIVKLGINT